MKVEIDKKSGFCFGVIKAIKSAESELEDSNLLYCLGDIVHNGKEVNRLEKMGLRSISKEEYFSLKNCKVLIRAHGEPPETYEHAKQNNIELIDATCPVVLTLQEKVKSSYESKIQSNGQVVIFGKKGHAEIIGLNGQINHNAIIVENIKDVEKIDMSRPVSLYSQTTKRIEDFHKIAELVHSNIKPGVPVEIKDTICRQVSNRVPNLKKFAAQYDLIL
jgi:4-hydroxy-3-methylbut-2-enyl diphosphate reductase